MRQVKRVPPKPILPAGKVALLWKSVLHWEASSERWQHSDRLLSLHLRTTIVGCLVSDLIHSRHLKRIPSCVYSACEFVRSLLHVCLHCNQPPILRVISQSISSHPYLYFFVITISATHSSTTSTCYLETILHLIYNTATVLPFLED